MTSRPENQVSPADHAVDEAGARKVKERVLIFVVAFLGLLIIGGLAAVVGRIIYLSSAPPVQPAVEVPPPSGASTAAEHLDLPAGAVVKSVSVSGDRLAVHYEAPNGAGIAVIDLASGAVLRRVEVVPGGTAR